MSATLTAITSPALAFAGGRGTYAWGEVGGAGSQVRRATLDLASSTPRTWSVGAPLGLGVIPWVAVAPTGEAAAIGAASSLAGGSGGPVIATTQAAGAAAWEAPVTLDTAGSGASIAIAGDGPVIAAWQRTPPFAGIAVAVREGLGGPGGGRAPRAARLRPGGRRRDRGARHGRLRREPRRRARAGPGSGGPAARRGAPRPAPRAGRRLAPGRTVFAVADGRSGTLQRASGVRAAVDSLGTSLLAWRSDLDGLSSPWALAAAAAGPFPAPVKYPTADTVEQVALAPSGRGEALVTWVADTSGAGRRLRSDRIPTGACATLPERPPPPPSDEITLSATQLHINQRIYSAAIRRAGALDSWLGARIRTGDLCGGTVGAWALGSGIDVAAAPRHPHGADGDAAPRRRPSAPVKPGVVFTLSTDQLRINQRIASRAVREANGLLARLDGGLSGGDVLDAAVTPGRLQATIAVAGLHAAAPTAPTRTIVAPATGKTDIVFTVSAPPSFASTSTSARRRFAG